MNAERADEARSKDDDGNPATPRRALASYRNYGVSLELDWTFCGRRVPGQARTTNAIDLGAFASNGSGSDVARTTSSPAAAARRPS